MIKRIEAWIEMIPRWATFLLWLVVTSPYVIINHFLLFEPCQFPLILGEDRIPFMAWTIYIYVSFFLFIPAAMYLIPKEKYGRVFLALCVLCWAHFIFFIFFPVTYPRTYNDGGHIFFAFVKLLDQPNNCFPSLHVAIAMFLTIAVWRTRNRQAGVLMSFWTLLIIMSTLTVKQHYALDIIGGIVTSVIASFIF